MSAPLGAAPDRPAPPAQPALPPVNLLNSLHSTGLSLSLLWPHRVAGGILVPRPGMEPTRPAAETRSLNEQASRDVPGLLLESLCFRLNHLTTVLSLPSGRTGIGGGAWGPSSLITTESPHPPPCGRKGVRSANEGTTRKNTASPSSRASQGLTEQGQPHILRAGDVTRSLPVLGSPRITPSISTAMPSAQTSPRGPASRKDAEAEPSPRPGQLQRLRPAGPGSAPVHRSAVPQYLSHQKHPLNPRCLTQTPPLPPVHACGAKHDPHPNAGPPGRRDPSAGLRGDPCAGWHVSVGH